MAAKLLSGGNPQVAKGDGDGPVQAYIAAMPGEKRAIGERLDALVTAAIPDVVKAVKWNSPFYGVRGQGWFLSFHCYDRYVKVGFFNGALLVPPPPVASTQKDVRYLHVADAAALDAVPFADWIVQAGRLPGWSGT
ncbi:MAG: DUF1801 domain-containing protein [Rhizobiaceae bacterium]